ncbi:MAG TPA: maltotransferase domain-containing protein, partial [Tepidiformaceae bacterium]
MPRDGLRRVVIEAVEPSVEGGRFPAKRTVGDQVAVHATIFCDGHDEIRASLLWRHESESGWREAPMRLLGNDRWLGDFRVEQLGRYLFTIQAGVDHFATWRSALVKRISAGQDVSVEMLVGASLLRQIGLRTKGAQRRKLDAAASALESDASVEARVAVALDDDLVDLAVAHPDRRLETRAETEFPIAVAPALARFSTWYEMFPRSTAAEPGRHGTFKDVCARLPYVKQMGFDVLYLPPIHPVGRSFRKGPNNTLRSDPSDPGSPWAIGAGEGGHRAVHPELGTLDDLRALVKEA